MSGSVEFLHQELSTQLRLNHKARRLPVVYSAARVAQNLRVVRSQFLIKPLRHSPPGFGSIL